ncbi:hypothetical protein GCM10009839_79390 [Catenulispora yoronensis]|uniref:Secreted protein n=1 Tax=Catenulispora yoronensis TaxID=450799 RepID=A0ABP5GUP5_9ACTN
MPWYAAIAAVSASATETAEGDAFALTAADIASCFADPQPATATTIPSDNCRRTTFEIRVTTVSPAVLASHVERSSRALGGSIAAHEYAESKH